MVAEFVLAQAELSYWTTPCPISALMWADMLPTKLHQSFQHFHRDESNSKTQVFWICNQVVIECFQIPLLQFHSRISPVPNHMDIMTVWVHIHSSCGFTLIILTMYSCGFTRRHYLIQTKFQDFLVYFLLALGAECYVHTTYFFASSLKISNCWLFLLQAFCSFDYWLLHWTLVKAAHVPTFILHPFMILIFMKNSESTDRL